MQFSEEAQPRVPQFVANGAEVLEIASPGVGSHLHYEPIKAAASAEQRLNRAVELRRRRKAANQDHEPAAAPAQSVAHDQAKTIQPKGKHVAAEHSTRAPIPSKPIPSKPVPSKSKQPPQTAQPLPKASSPSVQGTAIDHQGRDIDDRDVLRGLQVALSAACDENLDGWLRGKTGLRLRRFLADLRKLEDLGPGDTMPDRRIDVGVGKKGRETERYGEESDDAELGGDEADPDDRTTRRRRAVKRRADRDGESQRKRKRKQGIQV